MQEPEKRFKIRVKFEKTGAMRYVGHLDTMRYFQKAIRRADIPIAYTRGFHPHPILSFAQPLGVGLTSCGEYFDMELVSEIPVYEAVDTLNAQMVGGFRVLGMAYLPEKSKKGMAEVAAARYLVRPVFKCQTEEGALLKAVERYDSECTEMTVTKKTRKSEKTVDLKPHIHELHLTQEGALNMLVSAGSEFNVRPHLVAGYILNNYMQMGEDSYTLSVHRQELYKRSEDGGLAPLASFILGNTD